MTTKIIASTEAQNNFGRLLDDVTQNGTRYIVKRRHTPQAVLLSLADLEQLLASDERDREAVRALIRELGPSYRLGETVQEEAA
ncbi:MAG TPA: type II toxin-antitoxin system Phd/YefM family antitoxin [Anaerolineae bacterium]|nr:type II toxin-antitoxin system Phd/YefM family antitoxin [Anaerolineae bacterium]